MALVESFAQTLLQNISYLWAVCKRRAINGNRREEFHHAVLVSEACTQAVSLVSRCFGVYDMNTNSCLGREVCAAFPSPSCPCAGSSLTPGDGVGSAGACASWLLWAGLFCSSWGRAEIPTCAAWKTSNKGLERVTKWYSWPVGNGEQIPRKKAFWQPAMFFIWPMTWHMEMFFTVFWNKRLLDYDFHFSRVLSTFPSFILLSGRKVCCSCLLCIVFFSVVVL